MLQLVYPAHITYKIPGCLVVNKITQVSGHECIYIHPQMLILFNVFIFNVLLSVYFLSEDLSY